MKKIFDIRHIIIALLVVVAVMEFINPKGIMPHRTVTKVDSIPYAVHDTIPVDSLVEVEVEVPVPYEVEKRVEVPVQVPVDTNQILSIFFKKNVFNNTLKLLNNSGTVTITDTISENKIVGRGFKANIKPKTIIDTVLKVVPPTGQWYAGFDVELNKPAVVKVISVGMMYKSKDDKLFKVGVGVENVMTSSTNGSFEPYIGGGAYFPVKKRR
jgi:hypothetical protein